MPGRLRLDRIMWNNSNFILIAGLSTTGLQLSILPSCQEPDNDGKTMFETSTALSAHDKLFPLLSRGGRSKQWFIGEFVIEKWWWWCKVENVNVRLEATMFGEPVTEVSYS